MTTYSYKAFDGNGNKRKGELQKESKEQVLAYLTEIGYIPIDIKKTNLLTKDIDLSFVIKRLNDKTLSFFCRQLHFSLSAGVPLSQALDIIINNSSNTFFRKVIQSVSDDLLKGESFSSALENQKVFPKTLTGMIMVGESSGNLDYITKTMGIYYEKTYRQKQNLKSSLIYPGFVGVSLVFFSMFALLYVLPAFLDAFADSEMELPFLTRALVDLSSFISANFVFLILAVSLLLFLAFRFSKTKTAKETKSSFLLNFKLYQKMISYRFSLVLSLLSESGVSITDSLELLKETSNNEKLNFLLEESLNDLRTGDSLSDSIKKIKYFDNILVAMIKLGEETGYISQTLKNAADFLEFEIEASTGRYSKLFEPVLMIALGIVLIVVMAAVVIPIFSSNFMYL